MEVVLTSAKKVQIFADIFRNLKNILTDVNISFSEIGLYIQGMDVTHALLVELKIKKEWFDNYNVTKNITMGINCETFFKILNCLKDDQNIKLNFDEDDDKLSISFSEGESISKDFELNLMEIDAELMDIPEKEYQMDICLKSQEFTDLIKELTIFNDIVTINCDDNSMKMIATGTLGKMKVEIKDEDVIEYAIEEDTNLELNFALNFLAKICHFNKLNTDLYFHCSDDTPLKIHYSLDDKTSSESQSYCRFFIAPKINE